MATAVETISNLERRVTIKMPLAPLQSQIQARLLQVAKKAKLAGFRPGKAPLGLVNQYYGDEVRDEVYSKAVETSFGNAMEENKLRIAGYPNIQHKPFGEAATEFEYTATFEIFPDVKIGKLDGIKVEVPTLEVSEADVEKTITVLQKQRVKYVPVTRVAKKEDRVNVSLSASVDGNEVEGTGDKGIDMVLGEPGRFADFDNALIGGKAGSTKTFDLTYPSDYSSPVIAGKTVAYNVTFNSVSEPELPKVDAKFAKELGVASGDTKVMLAEIKASLVQEVEKRTKARVKEQVFQGLVAEVKLELPKVLIAAEQDRMLQQAAQNLKQRGMDPANMQLVPEMFADQAQKSTALRLILSEIVHANKLHATPEQVRAMVDGFAQSFEDPSDLVKWYYADVKRLDEPAALATEDNVVEWVLKQAKVTHKKIKFDELMAG